MLGKRNAWLPYVLVAPYLIMFAIFSAYPIGRAFYMSAFDWGIFGPNAFVGWGNYVALINDARFWRAFGVTVSFTLMFVPSLVIISLLLAVLLHRALPGIALLRTVFFLPLVVNVAVAAIAFNWLFQPSAGFINQLLDLVGLPRQSWLSQPGWALVVITLVALWMNVGFMVIILLAGLENISDEIYEAARLDGSRPFHDLIYITIPLLKPILLIVMILGLINGFQVFGEVLIMTQGGPFGSTTVLTMLLYQEGFERFSLGRAAAIGVIITVVIASLSIIQFRFFRRQQ
jgi:ABC-type sugar transport system permease subunit